MCRRSGSSLEDATEEGIVLEHTPPLLSPRYPSSPSLLKRPALADPLRAPGAMHGCKQFSCVFYVCEAPAANAIASQHS